MISESEPCKEPTIAAFLDQGVQSFLSPAIDPYIPICFLPERVIMCYVHVYPEITLKC